MGVSDEMVRFGSYQLRDQGIITTLKMGEMDINVATKRSDAGIPSVAHWRGSTQKERLHKVVDGTNLVDFVCSL